MSYLEWMFGTDGFCVDCKAYNTMNTEFILHDGSVNDGQKIIVCPNCEKNYNEGELVPERKVSSQIEAATKKPKSKPRYKIKKIAVCTMLLLLLVSWLYYSM